MGKLLELPAPGMFKIIFKGTAIGLANKAISAVGTFFLLPLMLKQLGTSTFGIWMTISSSISLMGFLDLGIGNALMNYIAQNSDNRNAIIRYIKTAYLIQITVTVILLAAFTASFNYINWGSILNISKPTADMLLCIFITFVCFLINLTANSIYAIQRGLQNSIAANTWQLLGTITYLTVLYWVLIHKPTLLYISMANFGIPLTISIINSVIFLYKERLLSNSEPQLINFKEAIAFTKNSGALLFLQLAAIICFETDCLILAHYSTFNDIAYFTITAKIYSIPIILLGVYLQILWPAFANLFSKNEWFQIKSLFYRSLTASLIGSIIFVTGILLIKDLLLKYWLTRQADISISLFIAFGCWTIVNCIDNNIATMLNGLNKLKIQVYAAIFMVISNISLSIVLVKNYGVSGVVWGTFISTVCFSVIPFGFYIKKLFKQNIVKIIE